jgi:predicted nucleic acid-binding protein
MTDPVFVDSNILVYARDANEPRKQPLAAELLRQLWRERSGRLSMQVLSEFYVTVTRKLRPPLDAPSAWRVVEAFLSWSPQMIDRPLLQRARHLEQQHALGWWDALIVAAAEAQACAVLLSEDLQDGATYGTVLVRNPFKPGVNQARADYRASEPAISRHRGRGRPPGKAGRQSHR